MRTMMAAAALFSAIASAAAQEPAKKTRAEVELALCLDVSSSMNGLIDSAKARLWDIVNELARAEPTPRLRVTLYSYGHTTYSRESGWVRKELDFTDDLDKVNEKLFGLRTGGGTELVARVCKAAIHEQKWSDDPKALKLIFVCGNEPANQDKEVSLAEVSAFAIKKGIVVNTIYCGASGNHDANGWRDFALTSEGRYASIDQGRGTVAVATPFDKKLAELGAQLNDTYVFCGKEAKALEANQVRQDANAAAVPGGGAAAARALSKASGLYRFQDDLVQKLQDNPKYDVKSVKKDELPETLRKLSEAELEAYVKERVEKRNAVQAQIRELGQQRDAFVREEQRRQATAQGQATLDDALRAMIREQGKSKGLVFPTR